MIATSHPFEIQRDRHEPSVEDSWSNLATIELPQYSESSISPRLRDQDELIAASLARMCMSSLNAYRSLILQAESTELREFARIIEQQRSAQYRSLIRRVSVHGSTHRNRSRIQRAFPDSRERSEWLMAFWGLEGDFTSDVAEHIDLAECLLEEAYLTGRNLVSDPEFSEELNGFALSVCGARQRWEEIMNERFSEYEAA